MRVMLWLEKWILGAAFVDTSRKTEETSNVQLRKYRCLMSIFGEERPPPTTSAGSTFREDPF